MDAPLTRLQLDSRALQILAHPLRSRILSALRRDGPATATTLAEFLETNTGATSYHLRKLADVDLVEETKTVHGGKERWWKAATDMHGWGDADVAGDPDGEAASLWLKRHYFQQFAETYAHWLDTSEGWTVDWRDAATGSDRSISLSPMQLRSLNDDLLAVIDRYSEPDAEPGADVRRVQIHLHAFPREPS